MGENQEWCYRKEDGKLNPILAMTSEKEMGSLNLRRLLFSVLFTYKSLNLKNLNITCQNTSQI